MNRQAQGGDKMIHPVGFAGIRIIDDTIIQLDSRNEPLFRDSFRYHVFWRKERDSNPRYAINVHTISSRAP